ncbi:MAG: polyamine ABC transporter ATP-binding protein [Thermoprotei archaeon]|nr:MAG: polyamine ABC transporter ATP-binding protein [Thermoprotei archaeon]
MAVRVVNLVKRYPGVTALDGVTLEVGEGEYMCIIGPSGSGKSTLLKCIAGILEPDEGDVYLWGRRVNRVPIEERGVGLIFQEILLFPYMTVRGNVFYPAVVRREREAEKLVREVLSTFNLELRARSMPEELSPGEQQKAAIARALASGARLLLMDEPYGSMDPRVAAELRREVRALAKDLGLTVIHVTHDQEEAMAVADRIAVMRRGRIEQVGTPEELYLRPKTLFVARFIGGENNFLECRAVGRRDRFTLLEVGSSLVKALGRVESGRAVLVVRPERLRIAERGPLEGVVRAREFLGKMYKYVIDLEGGGRVLVKEVKRVEVGARVRISFSPEDALAFPYPPEGLEEAIRYE